MIGGSLETLAAYIGKLNQSYGGSTNFWNREFFLKFKLIHLHKDPWCDFWIFAFCHHSHEFDESTWVHMREKAESMNLIIHEQILNYLEQKIRREELAERIYDSHGDIFYEGEEPFGRDKQLNTMEALITERFVFDDKLKAAFEL